ncbi:hypothetical protein HO133_006346 [Letharia lupina]|uniref:3-phytase n=2 Tax=Letharia TaxID=112415 RepID=A0A8H6C6W2_9LECA|nr:uncharacterized protein HO133_006346 [Letharia lupina]XP_037161195.1 uncharacterized protein HO173_010065 [Letharia columbiana]KAF6217934.1 hypothetical protein HO133_006346 [Letharia lupina]KAF6231763.1 hypothetical protein HO173_010065 [Letharia columbiana]
MTKTDWSSWDKLQWRRRLETFGDNDASIVASGPNGEIDTVCNLGELTDKGRETTLALGERLRHLYVDQLKYMPKVISDADMIYLRASPLPRALESVQESFWGMYPLSARTSSFPPPTIITRTPQDETLFPNESSCRRFSQLSKAFAQRTADRWNESQEIEYLNILIGKWMPDNSRVQVDSHPRLSGIMDTINSTLGHGPATRLPSPFYDPKGRDIIEKIGVEEWFSGFSESKEYRQVGIGALAGDIVARMIGSVEKSGNDGLLEIGGEDGSLGAGRGGEKDIKFGLSGCHDTSLAALLASLGCFEGEKWPPYTSHLALELFKESEFDRESIDGERLDRPATAAVAHKQKQGALSTFFGSGGKTKIATEGIARKTTDELSATEREKLKGHYVRIRYNDRPVVVPGCKLPGKHLDGDESFCTLEAFKAIVDGFTPKNWKQACITNIDKSAFPESIEPGGY